MRTKQKIRIFLAILSGTIVIAGIGFLALYFLVFPKQQNTITVQEDSDITYRVYQKNNPYIAQPFLEMNKNYLRTYTDYISSSNTYNANLSEKMEVAYTYRVVVTLISRYNKTAGSTDNPEVMVKEHEIDSKSVREETDYISLSNSYNLYPQNYTNELDMFAKTVNLPISNEIRVDFIVDLKTETWNSTFRRSMTVPLSGEFFNITIDGDKQKISEHNAPPNRLSMWTQIIIVLAIVLCSWVFFIMIKRFSNAKSMYRQTVEEYLKAYDDIIVNAETTITFDRYQIIKIKSFKEMAQLSAKLSLPIVFVDCNSHADFYITSGDIAYLFKMQEFETLS